MTESPAPLFEPGDGSFRDLPATAVAGTVFELGNTLQHFYHVLGIGLPIGSQVQGTACFEFSLQ